MAKKNLGDNSNLGTATTRKVQQVRRSLYICLPKLFCMRHNIRAGDMVGMFMGENLKIVPMEKEW